MAKGRRSNNRGRRVVQRREHRINQEIRVPEVRLVGLKDAGFEDMEDGVYPTRQALDMAQDKEEEQIEVTAAAKPTV